MQTRKLIDEFAEVGVRLTAKNGQVVFEGPREALTPARIEELRRHKAELLAALTAPDPNAYEERAGILEFDAGLPRLEAETLAAQEQGHTDADILERDQGDKFTYSVLDPSAFAQTSGPSIAERMLMAGTTFKPADNKRVAREGAIGGWDQMRSRLRGVDGAPMIYCFDTCKDSIRTIPVLQHDPMKAEDLDTEAEDHAADEWRYACMSRPWVPWRAPPPKPKAQFGQVYLPGPPRESSKVRIKI